MPRTVWISGDTHFGDARAIPLFRRPFVDAAAMDGSLIDAINRRVRKRDLLIHIGDFCGPSEEGAAGQVEHAVAVRDRIRCRTIRLIRGNHDPRGKRFRSLFDGVEEQMTFRHESGPGRVRVVLNHYPLRSWQGQLRGAVHLYGHAHGALEECGRSMDVGVDCWEYAPLRLDHAIDMLAARPLAEPDGWIRRQAMRDPDAPNIPAVER
jgi:calcineurin-like phosphoesterase family protein